MTRRRAHGLLATALAGALGAATFGFAAGGAGASPVVATHPNVARDVSGVNLSAPDGLAVVKGGLWVTNSGNNTVTELNATTGTWMRKLAAGSYGFDVPDAVRPDGSDVLVANKDGNSLTVVDTANGALVRVIRGDGLNRPVAMSVYGAQVFVVNSGRGGSVSEITVSTGKLYRTFPASKNGFNDPVAEAVGGADLFVVNEAVTSHASNPGSVSVIDAATGRYLKNLTGSSYGFHNPAGIAYDGSHVWVTNSWVTASAAIKSSWYGSVTEIDASKLSAMRVISNKSYPGHYPGFNSPTTAIAYGADVFVGSSAGPPMMTQIFAKQPSVGFWKCNSNGAYNFSVISAEAVSGVHLWVASLPGIIKYPGNSITDLNVNTGALLGEVT